MSRQPQPIATSLHAIATDWPRLLEELYAMPGVLSSGMPSGSDEAQLPGGERLSLAAETSHLLLFWVRLTLDEHPAPHRSPVRATDIPGMCGWLRHHVDWIEARYAIGPDHAGEPAAAEFDDLARRLSACVEAVGVIRPAIGPCTIDGCPGTIRGYIETGAIGNADLTCDTNPDHRWEEDHWVDLSASLGHDEPPRLSPDAMADYLSRRFGRRITRANLDVWATRYSLRVWLGSDGLYDRVAITDWYIGWQMAKVGA